MRCQSGTNRDADPPRDWRCVKCGREVTNSIAVSIDPRYATGLCLHGKSSTEREPERVALVLGKERVEHVIDQRTEARTVKRALRRQLAGESLSANEAAALDRRAKARAEA